MFPVPRRAGKIRGAEITDQKFREQRLHRADGAERRDGGDDRLLQAEAGITARWQMVPSPHGPGFARVGWPVNSREKRHNRPFLHDRHLSAASNFQIGV